VVLTLALSACGGAKKDSAGGGDAPLSAMQVYHVFFLHYFDVVEYNGMHGPWQLFGHEYKGETRLTKMVFVNQIEGFEEPVLVLFEYPLEDDGVTLNEAGRYNAYLVRDGNFLSGISVEDFDRVFELSDNEDALAAYRGGERINVTVRGENLYYLDFAGDVRTDGSLDRVIGWFAGYIEAN
jgi:hypothetical protein